MQRLSDAGNNSVFGLIDWDGINAGNNRIHVISENIRNGLENIILDPLIIALLIMRDFKNKKTDTFGNVDFDYFRLDYQNIENLQFISDCVSNLIFTDTNKTLKYVSYGYNTLLTVPCEYLSIDDHKLECKILNVFPFLRKISTRGAGALMTHIVSHIFEEHPNLIPQELYNVMDNLLNIEVGE